MFPRDPLSKRSLKAWVYDEGMTKGVAGLCQPFFVCCVCVPYSAALFSLSLAGVVSVTLVVRVGTSILGAAALYRRTVSGDVEIDEERA